MCLFVLDYALDDDEDQTIGGYFSTAGTGFLTVAGGSAIVGKFGSSWGNSVAARLPGWTGPISNASHMGHARPYNWGSFITEDLTNRVGGANVGLVNTYLQPGEAKSEDLVNGMVQGFANGATGPLSGRHASGW